MIAVDIAKLRSLAAGDPADRVEVPRSMLAAVEREISASRRGDAVQAFCTGIARNAGLQL